MNVKTFGPVDERSLEQLERCMEAGDADFGLLCADHHPGYSQPIGGGADEAPEVYKRLPDVLAAHAGSVRVKHRLKPLGVAMAGREVYDPYKD